MTTTSGASSRTSLSASVPVSASPTTSTPCSSSRFRRPVRNRSWSSTSRTRSDLGLRSPWRALVRDLRRCPLCRRLRERASRASHRRRDRHRPPAPARAPGRRVGNQRSMIGADDGAADVGGDRLAVARAPSSASRAGSRDGSTATTPQPTGRPVAVPAARSRRRRRRRRASRPGRARRGSAPGPATGAGAGPEPEPGSGTLSGAGRRPRSRRAAACAVRRAIWRPSSSALRLEAGEVGGPRRARAAASRVFLRLGLGERAASSARRCGQRVARSAGARRGRRGGVERPPVLIGDAREVVEPRSGRRPRTPRRASIASGSSSPCT